MTWFRLILLSLLLTSPLSHASDNATFDQGVEQLKDSNFNIKLQGVEAIATSGHPNAARLLGHLLQGELFYRKQDQKLVIGIKDGRRYQIADALSAESLGIVKKRELEKIRLNNQLRGQIRSAIATLNLSNPDASVRLAGVNQLLDKPDPNAVDVVRKQLAKESDPTVIEAMRTLIALEDLKADDTTRVLAAIQQLAGDLRPAARNGLTYLAEQGADKQTRQAARKALAAIETRLQLNQLTETLFFGLSLGSVLVLAAIGLAITFGVMGVINMAHGELIMLGAYTTYIVQLLMPNHIDLSLFVAVPAAFIVSGLVGIAIERGVIRFLYGRPLETLLATFGISLILQQLVRTAISAQNVAVENPGWMSGSLEINAVLSLTYNRLYIIFFALLVFTALQLVLKKTALGLQVRAVSQNRAMARAMGVRSAWVDAMTFGLGSGIAGVAGVALSQLTNVGPNLGQAYIIDSFMVVVFGGVGNLWGTLVAGMSLGVANKFIEPWAGAVLAKILMLVFIILFIQKRPRGLFPQKGRAAEG
ncbi:urea ABC transporter permease subunit UrtB [Sedimenticola selenatireducens]|uniref:urea ABC transporter permease subunit UrtB n=1 Tax=Sedimenticola selenatireducens TaxID=191960 RepID=UPI003F4AEAF6